MSREYESERTTSREDAATVLRDVADGVEAGTVRLGEGAETLDVDVPAELDLEIEFEPEEDELGLEIELEWPRPESDGTESETGGEATTGADAAEETPAATTEATAAAGEESDDPLAEGDVPSDATFELFRDKREEWRWRLVHRNGNVIATSGEGYTRKHNAKKGLRSVKVNASEAGVTEDAAGN